MRCVRTTWWWSQGCRRSEPAVRPCWQTPRARPRAATRSRWTPRAKCPILGLLDRRCPCRVFLDFPARYGHWNCCRPVGLRGFLYGVRWVVGAACRSRRFSGGVELGPWGKCCWWWGRRARCWGCGGKRDPRGFGGCNRVADYTGGLCALAAAVCPLQRSEILSSVNIRHILEIFFHLSIKMNCLKWINYSWLTKTSSNQHWTDMTQRKSKTRCRSLKVWAVFGTLCWKEHCAQSNPISVKSQTSSSPIWACSKMKKFCSKTILKLNKAQFRFIRKMQSSVQSMEYSSVDVPIFRH